MSEIRFTFHPEAENTFFEMASNDDRDDDDDRGYVYDHEDLMEWLEEHFGPQEDISVRDGDGFHPQSTVYEVLPFHVKFFGRNTDAAIAFRLRWC